MTPEAILENKPHLTLGEIYAAIAYYYANKELLDADFAAYDQECEGRQAFAKHGRREKSWLMIISKRVLIEKLNVETYLY